MSHVTIDLTRSIKSRSEKDIADDKKELKKQKEATRNGAPAPVDQLLPLHQNRLR